MSKEIIEQPQMQIATTDTQPPLVPDEKIVKYYDEAMSCIKEDRNEAHDKYMQVCEMVFNEGDPSSSTKEAMVNLLKIKSDSVNQMIKILDLYTRLHMKERHSPSQIYAFQQNNKYEGGSTPNPRIKRLIELAQNGEIVNEQK